MEVVPLVTHGWGDGHLEFNLAGYGGHEANLLENFSVPPVVVDILRERICYSFDPLFD